MILNFLFYYAVILLFVVKESVSLTIKQGAYEDIWVAIQDDPSLINETNCHQVISSIKDMFNSASLLLYSATDNKVYFKSVNILLPPFLNSCDHYTINTDLPKNSKNFESSDIKISSTHPLFGDNPFTQQPRQCGQRGDYIYMSTNFLNLEVEIKARILVHEFAKFRYGVFQEYGHKGDPIFPAVYTTPGTNSTFINECSDVRSQCSCSNLPSNDGFQRSSLLSTPLVLSVNEFCSERTHLKHIPTKHNLLCDKRSIKEQIMLHSDMRDTNPSTDSINVISINVLKSSARFFKEDNNKEVSISKDLYNKSDSTEEPSSLSINVWASNDLMDLKYTFKTAPAIFAEITSNNSRILNANILVKVIDLHSRDVSKLILRDSGIGADVTGNDGIYSGYLVGLRNPGIYTLDVQCFQFNETAYITPVLNKDTYLRCCGSQIQFTKDLEIFPILFSNFSSKYEIEITSPVSLSLGPSRITDLIVTDQEGSAKLTFSAPGNELDQGKEASSYIIYISELSNSTWITQTETPQTHFESGYIRNVTIYFNDYPRTATFYVRAMDDFGRIAPQSNHVQAYISCQKASKRLSGGEIFGIIFALFCFIMLVTLSIYLYLNYDRRDSNWAWGLIKCKICFPA